jgi:cell division ATPase FtsA
MAGGEKLNCRGQAGTVPRMAEPTPPPAQPPLEETPVRLGVPTYGAGLADIVRNPRYATAVGLLFEGRDQWLRAEAARNQTAGIGGVAERMREWFKANF